MMTHEEIRQRGQQYGCCALDALYSYVQSSIYGDNKCAEKSWRMFLYLRWAQAKMCDPCLTDGQKCAIIKKADCYCECRDCPYEEDVDCTITPFATVIAAIPFDELPIPCSINLDFNNDWNNDWNADVPCVNVQPGDSYYILTGPNAGAVYTWAAQPDFNSDYNLDFNTQ